MSWWTRFRDAVVDPIVDETARFIKDPAKVALTAAAVVAGPEILAAYGPEASAAAGAGEAAGVAGASELGASFGADMTAAGYGSTAAGAGLTLADIAAGVGTTAEALAPTIAMAPENAALLSSMGPETASSLGQSFAGDMAGMGYGGAELGAEGTTAAMQGGFGQGAIAPETSSLASDAVSTATNVPVDATAAEGSLAKMGEPGLTDMFKSGWETLNKPLWEGGPSARQGMSGLQLAGGLYDMYAKNQMAKSQQQQADQIKQQISQASNMYAPGSPEYNMLMEKLARLDAKAGRNSQYATREQTLASLIAQQKANMLPNLSSMTNTANQIQNQAMGNRYGSLNSLFSLAGKTAVPKVIDTLGGA